MLWPVAVFGGYLPASVPGVSHGSQDGATDTKQTLCNFDASPNTVQVTSTPNIRHLQLTTYIHQGVNADPFKNVTNC
jgi:hypothetical protein